jgi:hypothetical protein
MKTGVVALMLLLPTFAAAKTGNDLLGDCSVALKLFNHENVAGDEDFIRIGNCIGFVTGVMETAQLGKNIPDSRQAKALEPLKEFCAPPDVSIEQVVRISIKRLESHPQEQQMDAAVVILRALSEGYPPETCIAGPPGKQAEGLHWPDLPKKTRMRMRLVAVAMAEKRSSYFSNHEVLLAETEIGDEEWSLIKLVFTYLPYQPSLSEAGFDYSMVHEVAVWRNTDCDDTVAQLQERIVPGHDKPLIYARNVPRVDLDRRRIPVPCYEAKADDYVKSSFEPIPGAEKSPRVVLQARPTGTPPPAPRPSPTPTPSGPVLLVRPTPE